MMNFSKSELNKILSALELFPDSTKSISALKNRIKNAGSPKRIKPSSGKGKGRQFQQWICGEISDMTGVPYDQSDDQCLIHSREMGQRGTDVVLRGGALYRFPFSIEAKRVENIQLDKAILQAQANESAGTHWLVVNRKSKFPFPIVIMSWKAFRWLYEISGLRQRMND